MTTRFYEAALVEQTLDAYKKHYYDMFDKYMKEKNFEEAKKASATLIAIDNLESDIFRLEEKEFEL